MLVGTASPLALVVGLSALGSTSALAAGVDVAPGQIYNAPAGINTIDYLNIAPGGTVQLGTGNLLKVNDNNVDTSWGGFVLGTADTSAIGKIGNGTVTLNGISGSGGEIHIDNGTLLQDGGTNTIWYLSIGSNIIPSANGTLLIKDGTLNIMGGPTNGMGSPSPALQVGDFGGTGTVTQTGGTVNFNLASLNIGNQGGTGTYTITGGTIDFGGGGFIDVGRSAAGKPGSNGTFNIGGTALVDVHGAGSEFVIGNRQNGVTAADTSKVSQTGGTVRIRDGAELFLSGNKGTSEYDLNGGTLEIGGSALEPLYTPSQMSGGVPGTYTFNLGGGTIKVIGTALNTSVDASLTGVTSSTIDTNGLGATWNGGLGGSGNFVKAGDGTLTFATSPKGYTGSTTINGGTLALAAASSISGSSSVTLNASGVVLDITAGNQSIKNLSGVSGSSVLLGTHVLTETSTADTTFAGVISSSGAGNGLIKAGLNTLTLAGVNTFDGTTTVQGGTLKMGVSNALASTTGLTVQSGTTFDLGGVGSQKINTAINLNGGSHLTVNLGAQDRFDSSTVATAVNMNGVVDLHGGNGNFDPNAHYDLARTSSGATVNVAGSTSTDDLLFLNASNPMADNASPVHTAYVTFAASGVAVNSIAVTPNEKAVGGAIPSTLANPVFAAISTLSAADALKALDQLEGDFHASTKDALDQSAGYISEAVLDRLDLGLGGNGGGGGADMVTAAKPGGASIWAQAYGHRVTQTDGTNNAGELDATHFGGIAGIDGGNGNGVAGVGGGYSKADLTSASRNATGDVSSIHALAYAGGDAGPVDLRVGGSYSFSSISTSRTVTFPTPQTLIANYNAHTAQAFAEIGAGIGALEPFAGVNYINVATDGFTETGGSAALVAAASDQGLAYSTVGLRLNSDMGGLTLSGMAGWRHAFGDTTPTSSFTIQGLGYTVSGIPIAANAFVAEAGVAAKVGPNATVGVSYAGQIANGAQDNGAKATALVKF